MSYTKDPESKIVRTNHIISIYKGSTGKELLEDIKHLPFESVFVKLEEDGDEVILTFIEEKND